MKKFNLKDAKVVSGRIHRSTIVGLGVLPLRYNDRETPTSPGLTRNEIYSVTGIADEIKPIKEKQVIAKKDKGGEIKVQAIARIDSNIEMEYYNNYGILQYVLRQFLNKLRRGK